MSLNDAVMLGAAGAAAVFAARSLSLPVVSKVVNDAKPGATSIPLPLPHIGKPGAFGYEWAIIPAAIGYFLSK